LGAPKVLLANDAFQQGPMVQYAPSSRGKAKSFLRAPVVVTAVATDVFYGPTVGIAQSRRPIAKPRLLPVPAAFRPVGQLNTTLAYSLRGKPKSFLRRPVDLVDREDLGSVRVTLAYSLRGLPKPSLNPPTAVFPFFARPTVTAFARILPPPVHSVLRRPVDLVDREDVGVLRTHLAYSLRGKPKSHLGPPVVIDLTPQTKYLAVTLAYSLRGRPKSKLGEPSKFAAQPKAELDLRVTLAYSLRGKPKSVLRPPVVIDLSPQTRFLSITLSPSHRLSRRPIWKLGKPTDLVDRQDLGEVRVYLAYSLRGKPKSVLRKPVVVFPFFARKTDTTLVRIRPFPTTTKLAQPTDTRGLEDQGEIRVTLAKIRPKPTTTLLRPPVVIDLTPQTKFLGVHLTYSSRGIPKSLLRQASLFAPVPKAERVLAVTLAYSLRGKAKSILRLPVVVTPATPYLRPIDVTLAPQSRGKAKPRLTPPSVDFPPVPPAGLPISGYDRKRRRRLGPDSEEEWLVVILSEL
jgi:hypothetical protein